MIGEVPSGSPRLACPSFRVTTSGAVLVGGCRSASSPSPRASPPAVSSRLRGGYRVETDRELVGMGAANVAAGLSGGLAVSGSLSKTATADQAGSGSQITGLTAAAFTMIVIVAFTWVFTDLPQAVLSAIVVAAVWGLIDVVGAASLSAGPPGRLPRGCGRCWRCRAVRTAARARHRHCDITAGDRVPVVATTYGRARQDRRREGCVGQTAPPP